MKETNHKLSEKIVGATISRPHFKEKTKGKNGITLIALIITIIVMMILVGVTVTVAINGGLFDKIKEAKIKQEIALIQDLVETEYLNIKAEKIARRDSNVNVLAEEVLSSLNKNFTSVNLASGIGNENYIGTSDEAPTGKCFIVNPVDMGLETNNGKEPIIEDGKIKDAFIIVDETSKIYYIKETQIQENVGGGGGDTTGAIEEDGDPLTIGAIEDLVDIATVVNSGTTLEGETVTLLTSLDFSNPESYRNSKDESYGDVNGDGTVEPIMVELTTGLGFRPIGNIDMQTGEMKCFNGSFEGNNNAIANLYINRPEDMVVGLFGAIGTNNLTEIKNITIKDAVIRGGMIRGVVATTAGEGTYKFIECNLNSVTIESLSKESFSGGILGCAMNNANIEFSKCNINESEFTGESMIVGGLFGFAEILVDLSVGECDLNKTTIEKALYCGGLIGYPAGGCNAEIVNSTVESSTIKGEEIAVGIACSLGGEGEQQVVINGCKVSNSNIIVTKGSYAGVLGVTGGKNIEIAKSYLINTNMNSVDTTNWSAGIVGLCNATEKVLIEECYVTGGIIDASNGWDDYGGSAIGIALEINSPDIKIYNCYTDKITIKGDRIATGICGYVNGKIEILGCYTNSETVLQGKEEIAGILGPSYGEVNIKNCYNAAGFETVEDGAPDAGGIISSEDSGSRLELYVDKSINYSDILFEKSTDASGIANVGNAILITNSANYGDIKGRETAGITYSGGGNIYNCYNIGDVSGDYTAGIAYGDATINNCYNLGKMNAKYKGCAITDNQVSTYTNCYELTGNETTTEKETVKNTLNANRIDANTWSEWKIVESANNGYPIFVWENVE